MRRGHRGKKQKLAEPASGDLLIGYYGLAFIDILNQKEKLSKITKLPENEAERAEFILNWRESFGVVKGYRTTFDDFFNSSAGPLPADAGKEERELIKLFRKVEIKKECFSDTMIYYAWVMEAQDRLGITAVHALLSGCAATFLLTLSMGLVCRGGVEVGIAGEFAPGDLYGPALYHAHRLESEDAEYPRIAVGQGLIDFIGMELGRPGDDHVSRLRRTFAQKCRELLTVDVDGVPILDYAGPATKEMFPELRDNLEPAITFVDREWGRFKSERKTKLAARYFMLRNYLMQRRNTVWKEPAKALAADEASRAI